MPPKPKHILITGASSGIGAALARAYAGEGIMLALLGRHTERLEQVAALCRESGAQVEIASIDVRDAEGMRAWIEDFDTRFPVDLVYANAGISAGMEGNEGEGEGQLRTLFDVNITGVLNTLWPLIPRMRRRKRGQIAIMSSLASFRPLPPAPGYSASKACVRFYGEAIAGPLRKHGIHVSVVCPGYIDTPLTRVNRFPMPFLMDADRAAARILPQVACGKLRICFPRRLYFPLYLLSILSPKCTDWLFNALPSKPQIS